MRRCKCVECRVGKCSCVIEQFNDSSILLIRVCVAVKVCVCVCVSASVCCYEGVCVRSKLSLCRQILFLLLLEQVFGVYYTFFSSSFFCADSYQILSPRDCQVGGASQPSTEPQIKRRGWGHAELHLTHFGQLATTGITCGYFTWVFLFGWFFLFSPDGETSLIRCLIFPQHSLCHKCTVCVHLPLPSLPSWVGFFF